MIVRFPKTTEWDLLIPKRSNEATATAAILATFLLLTGCAGDTARPDSEIDTSEPELTEDPVQIFEPDYLSYLSTMHSALTLFPVSDRDYDDESLISAGDAMCVWASENRNMSDVEMALVQSSDTNKLMFVSTQAISAINTLCPEHADWLANEWLLSQPDLYGEFAGIALFGDRNYFAEEPFTYFDDWAIGIDGTGYRVQCADGTWSMSGGHQGACSHHGGVY